MQPIAQKLIKRTLADAVFTVLVKTSSSGAGVLIGAVLARLISLEMMGVYFVVLHLVRVSSVAVRLGMPTNLMRLLAVAVNQGNWSQVKGYLITSGQLLLISFTLLVSLYGIFWPWMLALLNVPALQGLFWVLIACIAVRVMEESGSTVLKGMHQIKLGVGLLDSPRQLLFLGVLAILWLMRNEPHLGSIFTIYALATLPAIALCVIAIASRLHKHPCPVSRIAHWVLLKESAPYLGMNIFSILMASAPLWVASAILGTEAAGLYGAAVQLTLLISFFLGVANQITPASLAALYAQDDKRVMEDLLRTTARWGLIIATPALLAILLLGRQIMGLVYGEAYHAGYVPLVLLALAQYVNAAAGSPGMLLQMSGRQAALLKLTAFWVACNIGMGWLFAHWIGIIGVATASCIAVVGQNISMVYYVKIRLGVRTYARLNLRALKPQRS